MVSRSLLTRWWLYALVVAIAVTGVLAMRSAATPVPAGPTVVKSTVTDSG